MAQYIGRYSSLQPLQRYESSHCTAWWVLSTMKVLWLDQRQHCHCILLWFRHILEVLFFESNRRNESTCETRGAWHTGESHPCAASLLSGPAAGGPLIFLSTSSICSSHPTLWNLGNVTLSGIKGRRVLTQGKKKK